ncbi:MAG: hypothetical protein GYA31_02685 [Parcubacteria group bacterium]|nr:hypothetical protein [Parcubacteria group bacterium]
MITNSTLIRNLRKSLSLNRKQELILVGTLLGDGSLLPNSWGKNYRLSLRHGMSQKEYLFWKYNIFKNWTLSPPKYDVNTNSWGFRTISHSVFTDFAHQFYRNKKKKLPDKIEQYLKEPLVIAIWWMDDGNIRKDKGIVYGGMLNTQSFTVKENLRLKYSLEKIYGIKVLIIKDHGKQRLYISGKNDIRKFLSKIKPYCLKIFDYKFP